MTIIKSMPILYGIAKTKKIKRAALWVEKISEDLYHIITEHGQVGGKQQKDFKPISVGKNIGKSNETTPEAQAIFEMQSKWNSKIDSNYTINVTGIPNPGDQKIFPMLAQTFDKIDENGKQVGKKHKIVYPAYVQPKLNGVRNLSQLKNNEVDHASRKAKPWTTLKHLETEWKSLFKKLNVVIDGEIYIHGKTLQQINRLVKKYREGESEALEYWVYDLIDEKNTFEKREEMLTEVFAGVKTLTKIVHVPVEEVNSEQEIRDLHDKWVAQGFEGIIIRNKDGKYLLNHRSVDLQKLKNFFDDEYVINGYTDGTGRETGCIVFYCDVMKKGRIKGTFKVRPSGTLAHRAAQFKQGDKYIGKKLTVRYQELSEDHVPTIITGGVLRLEEDTP